MEMIFKLAQVDGQKIADIAVYTDGISDILYNLIEDEDEMFTIYEDSFSLYKIPTLNEILMVAQRLASLGLVIDVLSA